MLTRHRGKKLLIVTCEIVSYVDIFGERKAPFGEPIRSNWDNILLSDVVIIIGKRKANPLISTLNCWVHDVLQMHLVTCHVFLEFTLLLCVIFVLTCSY